MDMKTYAPETLGNATLLGIFEAGTKEWHEVRKMSLGGSDISTICGLNPFESAYHLYCVKNELIPNTVEENWPIRFGKAFEEPILKLWQEEHPEYEIFRTGTYQDNLLPFRHANPDALAQHKETGEWIVIEVKTGRQTWEDLPAGYYLQVQHYLDILGLQRAALVAVAGMTWHDYWIERDDFEVEAMRQRSIEFMECLLNDRRPEWDGSESTYQAVRYQHPEIDDTEVEIDSLFYLANAQDKFDEAEAELRKMKSQVLDAMGRAKSAYMEIDGKRVKIASRQAKKDGLPYLVVHKRKGK
jgi:putative phage-type endonuclease